MLFSGYADKFPSSRLINWDSPLAQYTAAVPVEAMAVPWTQNQTGFAYDSAKVQAPPRTLAALAQWVKANPGKFTYPAPPDFTGRAFVVHVLYELSGGAEQWVTFNEGLWREKSPAVWKYLNDIKPYLWRKGETHPESVAAQDQLFANGEIWMTISPYVTVPARNVLKGAWPKTTRTFVVEPGTYAFCGFLGIPANATNKAGALAAIDVLSSPEAQYQKALPDVWGDLPVVDLKRLSKEWQDRFANIPTPESGLGAVYLANRKVPVLHGKYFTTLENEWRDQVLRKR
jgi:putative spermidine/putrescine transport system substrate-binding protein